MNKTGKGSAKAATIRVRDNLLNFIGQTSMHLIAQNLGHKLGNCQCWTRRGIGGSKTHVSKGYCKEALLCYRCNARAQGVKWRNGGKKKATAMIEVGALPLWVRLRVQNGPDLSRQYRSMRERLDVFIAPFQASYSLRRTDLYTQLLLGGDYGFHFARFEELWDVHVHLIIWLRPGTKQQHKMVIKLLRRHWDLVGGADKEIDIRRTYTNPEKSMVENVHRLLNYTSKVLDVDAAEDVIAVKALLKDRKSIRMGRFGVQVASLVDGVEQLELSKHQVSELMTNGTIQRRRKHKPAATKHPYVQSAASSMPNLRKLASVAVPIPPVALTRPQFRQGWAGFADFVEYDNRAEQRWLMQRKVA